MKEFSKDAVWGTIIETLLRLGITYEISPIEVSETVPSGEVLIRIYTDKLSNDYVMTKTILSEVKNDLQRAYGYIRRNDEFWFSDNTKYMFIKPPEKRE